MRYSSTSLPISWFREEYLKGRLDIKPPYQRKPVWAARQKSSLIETILLGLPVPEIFIQKETDDEGVTAYGVVDGQQRIRTVLEFIGLTLDNDSISFSLDKLDAGSQWFGTEFSDLPADQKKLFFGYEFGIRFLDTHDDGEVRDMFKRLNKFLTPLRPQELRNALYQGPFIRQVGSLADDEYWTENRIVTPSAIRRMGDLEFVSELLIGVLHGPQGGSSRLIDEYYERYEDYDDDFPGQRQAVRLFRATLRQLQVICPDIKETRWGNKTDFYSLFVALAAVIRENALDEPEAVRGRLIELEREVNLRFADENAAVDRAAVDYVRAVQKGANDKARRAERHRILLQSLAGGAHDEPV